MKTTGESYVILEILSHQCIPNLDEIEVDKTKFVCKKRTREELTNPVSQIFKEEYGKVLNRGYELPKYNTAKTALCQTRRDALESIKDPDSSAEIELSESLITQNDGSSFLLFDFISEMGKRSLVFSGEIGTKALKSNDAFFLDGTFKRCPKQFEQVYTIYSDFGSRSEEFTNVYPVAYVFLEDKRKTSYVRLFNTFKDWGWSPKTIKTDFEAAVIEAIAEVFPETEVTGYSYQFNQCLWQQVQHLEMVQDYRKDEEVRLVCKMCAALALIPEAEVQNAWFLIRGIKPDHEKLEHFLDYFVDQWLNNPSIPIRIWNVHGQQYRTNNPIERWICKLNKAVVDPHPNIYFMIKKLKQDASEVHAKVMKMELYLPNEKRIKECIQLDQSIETTLNCYLEEDLFTCVRVLARNIKLG